MGTVFIALADAGGVEVREVHQPRDRQRVRLYAEQNALDMMLRAMAVK